jgi:hypothetical protein
MTGPTPRVWHGGTCGLSWADRLRDPTGLARGMEMAGLRDLARERAHGFGVAGGVRRLIWVDDPAVGNLLEI